MTQVCSEALKRLSSISEQLDSGADSTHDPEGDQLTDS